MAIIIRLPSKIVSIGLLKPLYNNLPKLISNITLKNFYSRINSLIWFSIYFINFKGNILYAPPLLIYNTLILVIKE